MNARLAAVALAALLAACASAPPAVRDAIPTQPEGASGHLAKPGWSARTFAVAAANPLAAEAGVRMLRAGGSAVDAAIAVQMVLTLVEPQSSGIGGGAFLLHYDGRVVEAYDGRETAPAAADENLFVGADGKPMPFLDAVVGGRAVGVPGALRMLEMAHRQHGRLAWSELFQPAIALAEDGFAVSPRLHALLAAEQSLRRDPVAAAYFYGPDGQPWPSGHRLRNPELAQVLRAIAAGGSAALHEGPVAEAIVAKVRNHPTNPGRLALADLAGYQPKQRDALCFDYPARLRRTFVVCGFPPPGSGAIAIGQILGILNETAARTLAPADGTPGAEWLHFYTEAARLAFADRGQYVADPDFVAPPAGSWASLLAPDYLAARAMLIGPRAMPAAPPGHPGGARTGHAPMPDQPEAGTSHISIVDGQGRALAMTTTIEDAFGARQMVRGFLLNNELTDFSFVPARRRRRADRQPGRAGQAPALVDGADAGVRQGHRRVPAERRQPRRRADHPLHGQAAAGHARLGPRRAAGDRPAELRLHRRPGAAGGEALPGRHRRRARGAGPRGARSEHDQRPAGDRADRDRLVRRRGPAPRRRGPRRLSALAARSATRQSPFVDAGQTRRTTGFRRPARRP